MISTIQNGRFWYTSALWKQIESGVSCDGPAGRHLGRGGPTNPPQKEQCGKTVRTVLRTGPGVQRPEAPTTNERVLAACRVLAPQAEGTLRAERSRNAECSLGKCLQHHK